jgi:hypothetical protein
MIGLAGGYGRLMSEQYDNSNEQTRRRKMILFAVNMPYRIHSWFMSLEVSPSSQSSLPKLTFPKRLMSVQLYGHLLMIHYYYYQYTQTPKCGKTFSSL